MSGYCQHSVLSLCLLLVLLALGGSIEATASDTAQRNIFGSSIIYGGWKFSDPNSIATWDNRSYAAVRAMGATATGGSINWCDIEPVPGNYNWSVVDATIGRARAQNLTVYAYTGNTPDWALDPSHKGLGYRFPPLPQYAQNFTNFFTALAQRYKGVISHYEFWNEQNGCGWEKDGCANSDSAPSYAPWLCRWYSAMKAGDNSAVLSVGGLDYNSQVTDGYKYIEDLYTAGAGKCFDAVAIHPYGSLTPGQELHWQAITDTYNVLQNHGDGGKELWVNEWGWNSADEDAKAKAVNAVLTALDKNFTQVTAALYLCLTDLPNTPDSGHDYGLCSQDSKTLTITPRASYTAFQNYPKS